MEIRSKVIKVIGGEALEKLEDAGYDVVSAVAVAEFRVEHARALDRVRSVAKAAIDAAGSVTLRVEVSHDADRAVMTLTHPAGDEERLARIVAQFVAAEWPDKAAAGKGYETTDVPFSSSEEP